MADANVQAKIKLERYRSSKESGTNSVNIKANLSVNNEKRHITEKGLRVVFFFHDPRYNFKQSLMRFTELHSCIKA